MRLVTTFTLLLVLPALSRGEDKSGPAQDQQKRVEELTKKIAEKKAEVAKLESELAKLKPFDPKPVEALNGDTIEVGAMGPLQSRGVLGEMLVDTVIDEDHILAKVIFSPSYQARFVVKMKTKGLADGKPLPKMIGKMWYTSGTQKIGRSTYYVLEAPPEDK